MKKDSVKQLNASTSKPDLLLKPYGFCCDLKDYDPTLHIKKEDSRPLFPSGGVTGGGPDIKFRLQHTDSISGPIPRSFQRTAYRGGYRGGYQNGRRKGQRDGYRNRGNLPPRPGRNIRMDGYERVFTDPSMDEPMICTRCRGPLRWYLEDEIDYAREMLMRKRQDEYNAEIERNVEIAIEKEKRRRRRRRERMKAALGR
ncbi:uncharacterized protein LOC143186261 [Calliopsis andreniformis]|uniref:uncharacterized protein LOC143186261 n=1 Tax=Calliopsis andreniformis TaxID=337506 RepID=UPI003FCD55EC